MTLRQLIIEGYLGCEPPIENSFNARMFAVVISMAIEGFDIDEHGSAASSVLFGIDTEENMNHPVIGPLRMRMKEIDPIVEDIHEKAQTAHGKMSLRRELLTTQ